MKIKQSPSSTLPLITHMHSSGVEMGHIYPNIGEALAELTKLITDPETLWVAIHNPVVKEKKVKKQ